MLCHSNCCLSKLANKRLTRRFMICCDSCEEWYHGDCVGISLERGRQMEKASEDYTCVKCQKAKEKPTPQAHIPSSIREKVREFQ